MKTQQSTIFLLGRYIPVNATQWTFKSTVSRTHQWFKAQPFKAAEAEKNRLLTFIRNTTKVESYFATRWLFRDVLHTVRQMWGSQLLAFTNTNVYLAKINCRPFFPPQTGAAVHAYCLSSVPKDITAGRHPVFCVKIAVSFCDQWFAAAAAGFLLRLQPNASLCVCEQYEIFSDQRRELTPSIPHTCGHNLNCCKQPSDVRLWLEWAEFSSSWFSAAGIFFFFCQCEPSSLSHFSLFGLHLQTNYIYCFSHCQSSARQSKRSAAYKSNILLKFCFSYCFAILCQAHWLFRKFPVYSLFYTSILETAHRKHLKNLNLFKKKNLWMNEVKQKTAFSSEKSCSVLIKLPLLQYPRSTFVSSSVVSFASRCITPKPLSHLSSNHTD